MLSKIRYPVLVFYLVASVGAGALGAVQPWTHLDGQILQLTQFGPALGVLAVRLIWRRERWAVPLTAAVRPWPRGGVLAPAGTAAAIFAISLGWYAVVGADAQLMPARDLVAPFALIAVTQFVGPAGRRSVGGASCDRCWVRACAPCRHRFWWAVVGRVACPRLRRGRPLRPRVPGLYGRPVGNSRDCPAWQARQLPTYSPQRCSTP
jgi:hypothetical protein